MHIIMAKILINCKREYYFWDFAPHGKTEEKLLFYRESQDRQQVRK